MKKNEKLWWGIVLVLGIVVAIYIHAKTTEHFGTNMPSELVLINLNSRKDRLNMFLNGYNASDCKNKLPLHRIEAVVGKDVNWQSMITPKAKKDLDRVFKEGKRRHHSEFPGLGGVGCYLSHLKALEYVVQNNRPMIICEDDAQLPPKFCEKVSAGLQLVPPGKKPFLLLFHVICSGWNELKCTMTQHNFYEVTKFWSLACYYVTPESAKVILENAKPLDVQIDAMISTLTEKSLRIYAYPITKTNALGTDIQVTNVL